MTVVLPTHPYLRHPLTGDPLRAIYRTRAGRLVWPVIGASEPPADPAEPPAGDPPAPAEPPAPSDDLGDAGKKALASERAARKAAEAELAKYRKAEQEKADADKSEAEKRAAAETRAEQAELRVLRLEVGADKGLTPKQAARLVGTTREELAADADELITTFGAAAKEPAKPAPPKPDPSQGAKTPTTTRPTSLGQAVAGALKPRA